MTAPAGKAVPPVDVLAVMRDGIADYAESGHDALAEEMQKSSDIVAALLEANRKIVDEWNYMAKHGHCRPGVLGAGQTFDCWAVDLCETALSGISEKQS
jgi:hypothetical protein